MNGPRHYQEADRLLQAATVHAQDADDVMIALAQVHATLALAAATAETVIDNRPNTTVGVAWAKAVG